MLQLFSVLLSVNHSADKQDAMLSQGEPRDAAISFDRTTSCMRLLWYMSIYNDYAQPTYLKILMALCSDWAYKCKCKIWNP